MEMLEQLNSAIKYIESNLCEDIQMERVARIACLTQDSFHRFFSYLTGMTLNEYIRRRRLTLAAFDLKNTDAKVIDVAVKYGWDSPDAFARAFKRQHGVTPSRVRSFSMGIKIYPPASFHIMLKGAREMDFRIVECSETEVHGVSKQFDGQGYATREELRHMMWDDECEDIPGKICGGGWNRSDDRAYDGSWYGIWHDGRYMIAREKADTKKDGIETYCISAGTYAAFSTRRGGLAWEELPKLFELIFDSWLPNSPYRQKETIVIEVYHLWSDSSVRKKNRYYEVWIPIEEK